MSKLKNLFFHMSQSARWLGRYRSRRRFSKHPIHVVFCMVDHYEPGTGGVDVATEKSRVDELLEKFPSLIRDHHDCDGRLPRRTWFFPPHYHRHGTLPKLVELCNAGYGEIELHLHHGKHVPDTEENLEATILQCVKEYSQYGIFGEARGKRRYGFIHGDSALANSRGGKYCGVDSEIGVLIRTGCYADFTHPSGPATSPSFTNSIFYAKSSDAMPKSYDVGIAARTGASGDGLLIVQGPSHPSLLLSGAGGFVSRLGGLRIVGDTVFQGFPATSARVAMWVSTGVAVEGQEDVIFVKTATHGAPYAAAALGEECKFILNELETRYNDGTNFRLHYVTARELYNLIRSIEDGVFHSPNFLGTLNHEVSAPVYDSNWRQVEASTELQSLIARTYRG